jgi:hypothetical protein
MTLGVHALHVSGVVALLDRPNVGVGVASANRASAEQSDTGTGGGTDRGISRRRAERRACRGTDCGAGRSAGDRATHRGLLSRNACGLKRELSAEGVVRLELLEGLTRAGQHHHARTCWDCRAGAKDEGQRREDDNRPLHCDLAGTLIQGSVHVCTPG